MAYSFYTKIVGVTFGNCQSNIKNLKVGKKLGAVRELDNPFDSNAIVLYDKTNMIGHLSRSVAESLAHRIDNGTTYEITVTQVTGGGDFHLGVNVEIKEETRY